MSQESPIATTPEEVREALTELVDAYKAVAEFDKVGVSEAHELKVTVHYRFGVHASFEGAFLLGRAADWDPEYHLEGVEAFHRQIQEPDPALVEALEHYNETVMKAEEGPLRPILGHSDLLRLALTDVDAAVPRIYEALQEQVSSQRAHLRSALRKQRARLKDMEKRLAALEDI